MRSLKAAFSILNLLVLVAAACGQTHDPRAGTAATATTSAAPAAHNGLQTLITNDVLTVWATDADRQAAEDVAAALVKERSRVCDELLAPCAFAAVVEIYPSQASFDEHVLNPAMRGFFAISGEPHLIQMVSPANPAPHELAYVDAVQIAVHEFAHLVLDEVNPALPIWLDEGAAVFLGPHDQYRAACDYVFPFDLIPPFAALETSYDEVAAPDLFAFTAVEYVVEGWGMETLNALLRAPDDLEVLLGVSRPAFEREWHDFIHRQYHNYQD
jgi:hypothetical protein